MITVTVTGECIHFRGRGVWDKTYQENQKTFATGQESERGEGQTPLRFRLLIILSHAVQVQTVAPKCAISCDILGDGLRHLTGIK